MRILSIVTVGGRHIKWLGLYMIFMLSVQSCDMGFILPLNNNKFSYDISLSEDSMVKVRSMYFNGWHYLLFDLKGEYVMNPDSLKLEFCDKNIIVGKLLPCSETNTYKKNNTLSKIIIKMYLIENKQVTFLSITILVTIWKRASYLAPLFSA